MCIRDRSKTRLIGLAALLSLLLAIAYAGIAEFLDHRVLTASDIESRVKASVWEIVPEVERRGLPFQKTTTEPPPDSFRKAAWTVSKAAARGGTALLFSGSNRGAGTTTAILAIAEHLSERYRLRTLVIEADPAQASILDRLNLSTAQTLNRCAPSTPALSCVQKSASGVSYLPLEPGSPLPPARIGEVLAELRTAFDVVLIDGPVITDPDLLALSGSADGVVLIIEAGAIRYEELERLQRDWAAEEVRIAGVVLNRQKRFIPRWIYRSVVEAQ